MEYIRMDTVQKISQKKKKDYSLEE